MLCLIEEIRHKKIKTLHHPSERHMQQRGVREECFYVYNRDKQKKMIFYFYLKRLICVRSQLKIESENTCLTAFLETLTNSISLQNCNAKNKNYDNQMRHLQ